MEIKDKPKRLNIFLTAFIQVTLVSANTVFIANDVLWGIISFGFLISYVWSWNVKKIAIGDDKDRLTYATGAMFGTLVGYYFAKLFV